MSQKKKPKPTTVAELRRMWALTPFLMDELFKRADKGNRTATSIIMSAEDNMKSALFRNYIKRIVGGVF